MILGDFLRIGNRRGARHIETNKGQHLAGHVSLCDGSPLVSIEGSRKTLGRLPQDLFVFLQKFEKKGNDDRSKEANYPCHHHILFPFGPDG